MAQGDSTATTETPPPLSDDETLARAITDTTEASFAKSNIDNLKAETRIHPHSFIHYGRSKLSVDRYDRMPSQDAVAHGEELARMRGSNRRFHGWATLTRKDATSIGYDAEASPEGDTSGTPIYSCQKTQPLTMSGTAITPKTWPASPHGWKDRHNKNSSSTSADRKQQRYGDARRRPHLTQFSQKEKPRT